MGDPAEKHFGTMTLGYDMQAIYHRGPHKPTIALNIRTLMEMSLRERAYFYELWELDAEEIVWFEDKILIKKMEDIIQIYGRALYNTRENIKHGHVQVCDGKCALRECVCPVKDDEST